MGLTLKSFFFSLIQSSSAIPAATTRRFAGNFSILISFSLLCGFWSSPKAVFSTSSLHVRSTSSLSDQLHLTQTQASVFVLFLLWMRILCLLVQGQLPPPPFSARHVFPDPPMLLLTW
ncbi:hypothetical protein ACOSP7_005874 [Xanthoceras sorbifolium]